MAKLSGADLLEAFKEMTVLELSEFVKDFEETFGVTASMLSPGVYTDLPAHDIAPEEDEQVEFDVILESAGDKKIQVIKEVRIFTRLGLKEAKDLVERAPVTVLERADRATAEKAIEALQVAGGTVSVR